MTFMGAPGRHVIGDQRIPDHRRPDPGLFIIIQRHRGEDAANIGWALLMTGDTVLFEYRERVGMESRGIALGAGAVEGAEGAQRERAQCKGDDLPGVKSHDGSCLVVLRG